MSMPAKETFLLNENVDLTYTVRGNTISGMIYGMNHIAILSLATSNALS